VSDGILQCSQPILMILLLPVAFVFLIEFFCFSVTIILQHYYVWGLWPTQHVMSNHSMLMHSFSGASLLRDLHL
jgi:hypothetical protein